MPEAAAIAALAMAAAAAQLQAAGGADLGCWAAEGLQNGNSIPVRFRGKHGNNGNHVSQPHPGCHKGKQNAFTRAMLHCAAQDRGDSAAKDWEASVEDPSA